MNYGFTDEELANLSKWMLYYEIELKKNKKGFGKNRITPYLKQHNIIFNCNGKISNKAKHNNIEFSNTELSICVSFIRHVRNSFAHGLMKATKKDFILIDQKKSKSRTKTMQRPKTKNIIIN